MARTVYVTTELTGGGSGLDGIDGNSLVKGDLAFYINKNSTTPKHEGNYMGVLMATTKSSTEESPLTIVPDSNAGDWNWELLDPLMPIKQTTGKTATLDNYGISVIKSTAATVHRLKRPRRGTKKTIVFGSTSVVKIRLSTAAAAYTVKVGSSISVIAFTSRAVMPWVKPTINLVGWSTSSWRVVSLTPWSTNKLKFSSST